MVKLLEQPSLAIIIDCWAVVKDFNSEQHERYENILRNIAHFIENNSNINSIAIASYSLLNDTISYEEPFTKNSIDFFVKETKWDTIRQIWKTTTFNQDKDFFTHKLIKNINFLDHQMVFSAFTNLDILYYCNYINPSIKNIYFFGAAWDICVKYRPVGWLHVSSLSYHNLFSNDVNFLTSKKCVFNREDKNFEMENYWSAVNDEIYLLNKDIDFY